VLVEGISACWLVGAKVFVGEGMNSIVATFSVTIVGGSVVSVCGETTGFG